MVKQSVDLQKRHATAVPGVVYRVRADGSRTYYVRESRAKWTRVAGGFKAACEYKRTIDSRKAKGERVVLATTRTLEEALLEWYARVEHKLRAETKLGYSTACGLGRGVGNGHRHLRIIPRFGDKKLTAITPALLNDWIRDMREAGFSGSWIKTHLKPINQTFEREVREGRIVSNPVKRIDQDEMPVRPSRPLVILEEKQVARLLDAAGTLAREATSKYDYEPVLTVAADAGLRLSELLGLRWMRVDLTDGYIRVREQLTRSGELEPVKTEAGRRDVKIGRNLTQFLRELRAASAHSRDSDFVFASNAGGPLQHRNLQSRGFDRALKRAGLDSLDPKPVLHDLRHVFASRLIDAGNDVVTVADQMGHSDPNITLRTYAGRWNRASKDALLETTADTAWASRRGTRNGTQMAHGHDETRRNEGPEESSKVASLRRS